MVYQYGNPWGICPQEVTIELPQTSPIYTQGVIHIGEGCRNLGTYAARDALDRRLSFIPPRFILGG